MVNIIFVFFFVVITVAAESPCNQVPFVSRAEWNAREPTSITNLTGKSLSFYVIHHTYEPPNCYDDQSCIQRVQEIQNLHQNDRGWADIGYHFLVGENGKVYEGRGWNREAAHSSGWNNDAFGICMIGDFRFAPPNETALNAVRLWIACGVEKGYVKEDHYIITHRQSQRPGYTECPGDAAFKEVETWRRFCSYQNSGSNSTQPPIARNFCDQEFGRVSSASSHLITPLLFLPLIFLK